MIVSSCRLARVAVIAALVVALGLAGCGRKGGLDPPPTGATAARDATVVGAPEADPDGRPVAPEDTRRRTVIDWLID